MPSRWKENQRFPLPAEFPATFERTMSAAPMVSFGLIILVGGGLLLALVGAGVAVYLAAQGSRRDNEK